MPSFTLFAPTRFCCAVVTRQAKQCHIEVAEPGSVRKFPGCRSQPFLGFLQTAFACVEGREFIERGRPEGAELLAHFESSPCVVELLGRQIGNSQVIGSLLVVADSLEDSREVFDRSGKLFERNFQAAQGASKRQAMREPSEPSAISGERRQQPSSRRR